MEQSQRHRGDATVDLAKPLRVKRACVVRRETTQAKTQKQNRSHSRCEGGSRRKREAVKAEKHPSVDEPGPDVCNYLSTRAATGSIEAVPAAILPSQDFALLTIPSFLPNRDDDVPASPPPAEHSADSQILYAPPSPSFASTPTEEPERDWYLPVPEVNEPSDGEVHMHQRRA